MYGMDTIIATQALSDEVQQEYDQEEAVRKAAAERALDLVEQNWKQRDLESDSKVKEAIDDRVEFLLATRLQAMEDEAREGEGYEEGEEEGTALPVASQEDIAMARLTAQEQARKEAEQAKRVADGLAGMARNPRDLITYTIEVIRDMQTDISRAERDLHH